MSQNPDTSIISSNTARNTGLSPHLVEFNDDLVMRQAMETGETDACLTGSAVPMGSRVILSLPPLSSYMMLRADDFSCAGRSIPRSVS